MSTATDTARTTLQAAARAAYRPVYAAGVAFAADYAQTTKTSDPIEAMRCTVSLILSAAHLAEMAAEAEKAARAALAEQMSEHGTRSIETETSTAYLSRKPAFVSVDQPDLVPADYLRQPPPSPDKRALKTALEDGEVVPGCTLVVPNESTLCIKAKKG